MKALILFSMTTLMGCQGSSKLIDQLPDIFWEQQADIATLAAMASAVYENAPSECKRKTLSDWERQDFNNDLDESLIITKKNEITSGLSYSLYRKIIPGGITGIELRVIVFRGTELSDVGDWCANFQLFPENICSNQYETALDHVYNHLYFGTNDFGPVPKWIAVGHSLGGGLAMLAGYRQPAIEEIYVFNTSPIVGFDTRIIDHIQHEDFEPKIISITEKGEILSVLRDAIDLWNPEGSGVEHFETDFLSGNPLEQHSMEKMACNLFELSEFRGSEYQYSLLLKMLY